MIKKTRLVLADDHIMITDILTACLKNEPDFEVIAAVTNGQQLIDMVAAKQPDLVLTDIEMPGMDGVTALKILREHYPETKVIVISFYNSSSFINNIAELGAHGYLKKEAPLAVLYSAIRIVAAGGTYFETVEKKPLALIRKNNLLSRRETEVLELVGEGKTSLEIAGQLSITKDTVETHRKNMLRKLNLTGKTGLLRYALSYIKNYRNKD